MIKQLPFFDLIHNMLGGKIYCVGGMVRDKVLGRESKDIDLLITGVPFGTLAQELASYGKLSEVGVSFGIIKLVIDGVEYDIAIPRTEKKIGEGHHGFEVYSDHGLPIEEDLLRRDFTMNAMAEDCEGNIIDPYGGLDDIKAQVVRAVNPKAFIEDPLRMLRAVQFAVRFSFIIGSDTLKMIRENAQLIKEIPPERVLVEFAKIVKAGPVACKNALYFLEITGLFGAIFGVLRWSSILRPVRKSFEATNMAEFIYMLLEDTVWIPSEYYKHNLKGDIDTYKALQALELCLDFKCAEEEARRVMSEAYRLSKSILDSDYLFGPMAKAQSEFRQGLFPKGVSELEVNGEDLLQLGLQGKQIGVALKECLMGIYDGVLHNEKEELKKFAYEYFRNYTEHLRQARITEAIMKPLNENYKC